ncbi:CHAD domain-containing protein [Rhizobium sp. S152]|uniref:CHAD domain-containing protein n=1 Tax=Rhizobium sp. S152 TaxID=3055038 RepID=UPI0025A988E5|nr:CHAD domain-containing protein [Rhizobium sp. S152]MDM9625703.1 CHAD domain-containing protein [Rhizobium sp. S152]
MPFRIRPDRDFTKQFHKAASGQLRHAMKTLEERPDGTHEAIHAFRKNLKRVRSLLRLVARAIPDTRQKENARLRDIAASLSAIRDATALAETVGYLKDNARDPKEAAALDRVTDRLRCRRDAMADATSGLDSMLEKAIGELAKSAEALDGICFPHDHKKNARMLAKGWRDTARKAREAIDECRAGASAEAFHTLRKRTQDYRAYHDLLRAVWPAAMRAGYDAASELIDLLGHIHDLDVLCALVEAEPHHFSNADDLAHLLDAIIFRQQEDRQVAIDLAEKIFSDSPKNEARRIEALWIAAAYG